MTSQPHELLPGIPSQAASFISSADIKGNCVDGQLGSADLLGGQQGSNLTTSQPPSVFQPKHYLQASSPGESFMGTSWRSRLFYAESFAGTMIGDDAIKAAIGQRSGYFTGARLGLDYDDYWRVESRIGIAWMKFFDKSNPWIDVGTGDNLVWNLSLLYYPLGDLRWRPFLLLGTGISQLNTFAVNSRGNSATIFTGISHKE